MKKYRFYPTKEEHIEMATKFHCINELLLDIYLILERTYGKTNIPGILCIKIIKHFNKLRSLLDDCSLQEQSEYKNSLYYGFGSTEQGKKNCIEHIYERTDLKL